MGNPQPKGLYLKRKAPRQNNNSNPSSINFVLKQISPKNENQQKVFNAFPNKNLVLTGYFGTGKTFLALYLALHEILYNKETPYENILILRSAVSARPQGFLPGNDQKKAKIYELPYESICADLFDKPSAYEQLKRYDVIDFNTTSYIRGVTWANSIIIVDECQNFDLGELVTTFTRIGENSKIIFCGDFRQSDFRRNEEKNKKDINKFLSILENMPEDFEIIDFGIEDIVRNDLIKRFVLAADHVGVDLY